MVKVDRIEKTFWGNSNFLEQIEYTQEVPYYILHKDIRSNEIVPLHYAPTIEILLCKNLKGYISLGHRNIVVDRDFLVLIPPNMVHGTTFYSGQGHKTCLTISIEALNYYINIEHILKANNTSVYQLSLQYDCYDEIHNQIEQLISHDGDFSRCINAVLSIFEILHHHSDKKSNFTELNQIKCEQLQKLINWTNKNIERKIELEEAAAIMGLSKYYFCRYFKSITKMSYIDFLQRLRVARAEILLRRGFSVTDCCFSCGYENISYFIQMFRKHVGQTMLQYQHTYYQSP
jgi:AraC-like DNA-binding protein